MCKTFSKKKYHDLGQSNWNIFESKWAKLEYSSINKMHKVCFLTNSSDLLRTIWRQITSSVCWRRFYHKIFGRLGFSHYQDGPLTSYKSLCQYLVQVIKTLEFALTNFFQIFVGLHHCASFVPRALICTPIRTVLDPAGRFYEGVLCF